MNSDYEIPASRRALIEKVAAGLPEMPDASAESLASAVRRGLTAAISATWRATNPKPKAARPLSRSSIKRLLEGAVADLEWVKAEVEARQDDVSRYRAMLRKASR